MADIVFQQRLRVERKVSRFWKLDNQACNTVLKPRESKI